jgi:predicted MPP superfamily phosphohydrolase
MAANRRHHYTTGALDDAGTNPHHQGSRPTTGDVVHHTAPPACPHREEWRRHRMAMEAARRRSTVHGPRPFLLMKHILPPAGLLLGPLLAQGRRNAGQVEMVELSLRFPDLPPAFDGFTLLHLSDPHPFPHGEGVASAARLLRGMEADLAVLTGDVQCEGRPAPTVAAAALAPLLAGLRLRHGIVGVLGNHDGHALVPALEGLGVRMLINEHWCLERDGRHLVFTGTDDVNTFYTTEAARALERAPPGFRIALVHSPDLAGIAERAGFRLYLCGHTHGGQVCLPGGQPLITALDSHHDLARGPWRLGRLLGYTSRGVGSGAPAVRYNCPPEVTRLTLRRSNPAEQAPPQEVQGQQQDEGGHGQ